MALSRNYRLRKTTDIEAVLKHGRRSYGDLFQLFFYANKLSHARLAIVISKKVAKKAVIRNRLRRRLSGFINLHRHLLYPAFDVVCILRPKAAQFTRKEFYDNLKKNFSLPD